MFYNIGPKIEMIDSVTNNLAYYRTELIYSTGLGGATYDNLTMILR
jgi:hypothetical protein